MHDMSNNCIDRFWCKCSACNLW